MRKVLLLSVVLLCTLPLACSGDDDQGLDETDPMNAVAELGRPVELGYERTEWEPEALAAATALAQRTTNTSIGCVDPGSVSFEEVKLSFELVKLPMPGAVVQCFSNGEQEDLTFSAFPDDEAKETFIEAKAELICGRALRPEENPNIQSRFDGIVYVDAGTVIIEPDTAGVRNILATELQATPSKMCADAVGDTVPAG